ncbi:MAG: hypothetical protein ACI9QA_000057 [Methanobacteriota archaeon]|jgi:uncharacterized protein (UPF0212 family)|uniref:UPF0212 protein EGH25_06615 n=1 Tax=Halorutilus salinus TaxID=2487751 RepID=A0A9Q4GGS8_9EURY|nr:DUF555 domain-containing protein [Halorutilus salinus]MCX2819022.1 DUF555 domain-containing protein [Halorutilus salinus]
MNCRVVVEAAVPVYDVETEDEAIRIGISKIGEMLNPDLNYVEINTGTRTSPNGEELEPAFIAADEGLVALELEMKVFNIESKEHASRVARKEIGQRLSDIPLSVIDVEEIEEEMEGSEGESFEDEYGDEFDEDLGDLEDDELEEIGAEVEDLEDDEDLPELDDIL